MIRLVEETSLNQENSNTISVPVDRLDEVKKIIKRLQAKAVHYGGNFTVKISEPYYKTVKMTNYDRTSSEYNVKVVDVTVENSMISKGNYTVLAYVEFTPGGNVVVPIYGSAIKPEWYSVDAHCDHCNTLRTRNSVFIVQDDSTGKELQIGKSCLKDYTGINPLGIIFKFDVGCEIYNEMSEDDFFGRLGRGTQYIDVKVLLGWAIDDINKRGYIKKTSEDSTYLTVIEKIGKHNYDFPEKYKPEIDNIIMYMTEYTGTDNYMNNCRSFIISGYCKFNYIGLMCYLPLAVKREQDKETGKQLANSNYQSERDREATDSNYVGEVGQKITVELRSSKYITSFETAYGISHLYKFIDASGNVLVWFTSSYLDDKLIETAKKLMGTVKSHGLRDGVKQTVLTRCKLMP